MRVKVNPCNVFHAVNISYMSHCRSRVLAPTAAEREMVGHRSQRADVLVGWRERGRRPAWLSRTSREALYHLFLNGWGDAGQGPRVLRRQWTLLSCSPSLFRRMSASFVFKQRYSPMAWDDLWSIICLSTWILENRVFRWRISCARPGTRPHIEHDHAGRTDRSGSPICSTRIRLLLFGANARMIV